EVNEPERLDRKGLGVYRVRIRRWLPLAFETYLTTCWNCLGEFDALHAVWCSDDPKSPTKLCPFCFRCFCEATDAYKQEFWRKAPARLKEELNTLHKS